MNPPSRRVVSWVALGLGASLVELALLQVATTRLVLPLPLASALAAEAMILVKFGLADRYVFGHSLPTLNRLVRYHGASAGAFIVYWLLINGCAVLLGVPYVTAFVVGTIGSFAWSFITNFRWVWAA